MSESLVKAWLAELPKDLLTHQKKGLRRERGLYRPIRFPVRKVSLSHPIRRMKRRGTRKRLPPLDTLIHLRPSSSFASCSLRPNVSRGDDQQIVADTDTAHSDADVDHTFASEQNELSVLSSVKLSTRGSSRDSQYTTRTTTGASLKFCSPSILFVSPQNGRLDGKAVPSIIQSFQKLLKGITAGQEVIPISLKVSSLHHSSH